MSLPGIKSFGLLPGATSSKQAAHMSTELNNSKQMALISQGGKRQKTRRRKYKTRKRKYTAKRKYKRGGSSGSMRVVVPQASTHGMTSAGPNDANASSTDTAITILQSNANSQYDNDTTVKQYAVGGRKNKKRTKYRRRYR